MGIDIIGASNLIIKPVPKQYRAKLVYKEPLNTQKLLSALEKTQKENRDGLLALALVTTGAEKNLIDPDFDIKKSDLNVPPTAEISDESYKWEENEKDLFHVDWQTNNAYYKSPDSEESSVGRSYSGLGSFCRTIKEFTNEHIYFPCDAILDTSTCFRYYNVLSKTWKLWKDKYATEYNLPNDISSILLDKCSDYDWEVEFYIKLAHALKCGSESGIVICG